MLKNSLSICGKKGQKENTLNKAHGSSSYIIYIEHKYFSHPVALKPFTPSLPTEEKQTALQGCCHTAQF